MVIFRSAHQGKLKFSDESLPLGGSSAMPFVRE